MAHIPNKVQRIIAQYLSALRDNGFQIQDAILFGSYARGDATEWSDIDLALVSEAFDGVRFTDRNKIRKVTIAVSSDLEVLPFNPKDFTAKDPFVKEILETGVSVM
jgi:predicted nucleotidyltransferase